MTSAIIGSLCFENMLSYYPQTSTNQGVNSAEMPDFQQLPRQVAAGGRLAIMVAYGSLINIIHDIHVWTPHTVAGSGRKATSLSLHQLLLPFSWRCIFVGSRTSLCVGFEPCFKSGLRVHQDPTLTNDTCQSTAWTPSRTSQASHTCQPGCDKCSHVALEKNDDFLSLLLCRRINDHQCPCHPLRRKVKFDTFSNKYWSS